MFDSIGLAGPSTTPYESEPVPIKVKSLKRGRVGFEPYSDYLAESKSSGRSLKRVRRASNHELPPSSSPYPESGQEDEAMGDDESDEEGGPSTHHLAGTTLVQA